MTEKDGGNLRSGDRPNANTDCESGENKCANNRFSKGQSGNIRGRPKGSKNYKSIVKEIAFEEHKIFVDGVSRDMTTMELVLLELRNQVASGNTQAFAYYEFLSKKYGEQITEGKFGVLLAPAPISELEWIRRAMDKNRFSISPDERTARVDKILENNSDMSQLEADQQLDDELAAEKNRILETEKLHRADEILKADPTIDHDEAVRRAEAERRAWLNGERDSPDGKLT